MPLSTPANVIYRTGQPALLYIVPALIASALATAAATGKWEDLWAFNAQPEEEEEDNGGSARV